MGTFTTHGRFIVQAVISFILIGVCTAMLFKDFDNQGVPFNFATGTLTFIIGFWASPPKKPKTVEDKRRKYLNFLDDTRDISKIKEEERELKEQVKEKKRLDKEAKKEYKRLEKEKNQEEKEKLKAQKALEGNQKKLDALQRKISTVSGDTIINMDVVVNNEENTSEIDNVDFGTLEKQLNAKVDEVIGSNVGDVEEALGAVAEKLSNTSESDSPSEMERQVDSFKNAL